MKSLTTVKKKPQKSKLQTKKETQPFGWVFCLLYFLLTFMTKHQHCPLCHFEGHCLLAGDVGHSPCVNGGQSQVVKRIFKANRLRHSGTATIGQYGQGRAFGQMVATHTPFKVHHKVLFHCSCLCPKLSARASKVKLPRTWSCLPPKTP